MTEWRTPVFMFAATALAEFVIMAAFSMLPLPPIRGQAAAMIDAAILGVVVFAVYLVVAPRLAHRPVRNFPANALILLVVTVAFESQLHLTGQQFALILGATGVQVLNAALTASVVAGVTAWLTAVDRRLDALDQPSIPLYRALGRSIIAGAFVAAACVAAVPMLAGAHVAHRTAASHSAWSLIDVLGRERATAQRLGRLALLEERAASDYFRASLALAERQSHALSLAWAGYVKRNGVTEQEARFLHHNPEIAAARAHYVSQAHALAATQGAARDAMRTGLQSAVDSYALSMERASDVVAASETWRTSLHNDKLSAWLAPPLLFLLALGMLWPLLRLVAAQQSQLAQAFNQAQDMAHRDALTGLGNRRYLTEAFEKQRSAKGARFATLLIDLDRFKPINDLHGHAVGDRVLEVVAERLRRTMRADCAIARLGGDEFAILCPHDGDSQALKALAQRIIETLTAPIAVSGKTVSVGASIGVALYPTDAKSAQDLLHLADLALYRAKETRGEARFFDTAAANDAVSSNAPSRTAVA